MKKNYIGKYFEFIFEQKVSAKIKYEYLYEYYLCRENLKFE